MKIKIDPADTVFSQAIRTRDKWTCQRCHTDYTHRDKRGLECSHYFGRKARNTRFDPENCDALCTGCHSIWGSQKEDYRNFKINQLGRERFDCLLLASNTYRKKDKRMEYIEASEYLKLMEKSNENM